MIKRFVRSVFRFFNLKVERIPTTRERREREHALAQGKFGWLRKYQIVKIVDVGSNDGHFATEISKVFDKEPLFCFEPIPSVFASLKAKFSGRTDYTFIECALGDKDGEEVINMNEYSPSSSLLEMETLHKEAFRFTKNSVKQRIQIRRLDGFMDKIKPDSGTLLKIDVQGYELKVIRGGLDFIRRCRVIIIEVSFEMLYKDQALFDDIYRELQSLGFDYHGNIEQLSNPHTGEILQADSVFVNRNL